MNMKMLSTLILAMSFSHAAMSSETLEKADRYFEATLFNQAEALYLDVLQQIPEDSLQAVHVKRQLARSYFIKQQYADVLSLFPDLESESPENNNSIPSLESLFLIGASLNRLGQFKNSPYPLEKFLKYRKRPLEIYVNEAWFELGLAYFQQKQLDKAKTAFKNIQSGKNQTFYFALSKLYLSRIAIIENNMDAAQQFIQQLQKQPVAFSPYAVAFLQGELLFHQKKWKQAALEFEKAIPTPNFESFQWQADTLYYLGWCFLNLGKETHQIQYFEQAVSFFYDLNSLQSTDRSKLSLGQALLVCSNHCPNEKTTSEIKQLLSLQQQWENRDNKHQALLLLAEATSDFSEKNQLFRQAVHESFSSSPLYSKALYIKGLNEIEEGERLNVDPQHRKEARKYFEQSISSLSRAFDYLYPNDPTFAAIALKQQAYAHYYQQTREGFLKSLSLVSRLLNQYRTNLFPLLDNPDEIYFLQGLIASKLIDNEEHEAFFTIAENSLVHCIESYPKGTYLNRSFHLLGTLYLQEGTYKKAEQTFLELARQTPPSTLMGEAWYWAAEAAEKSDACSKKVQQYRKHVFTQTPHSTFADAAYFRYFSYGEYINGNTNAMRHLEELDTRFPFSPYRMNAHYLLGLEALQEKKSSNGKIQKTVDFKKAIAHFEKAAGLYEELPIPQSKKAYFTLVRYHCLIEQALTYTHASENDRAIEILLPIYQELQDPKHSMSSLIKNSEQKNKIEEESAYLLVQSFLDQNADSSAASVLSEILEKYHQTKTTRGYYLSRAWYQRGILAIRQDEPHFADQCFRHAEDAAKGKVLNTDELLDLWIQQSMCYQKLEKMDEAMLVLSKVINYDAVSLERLRAMYLRAEIYELQGRKELARRQLQATANKGGPWSLKAKEKLDNHYGYQ